MSDFPVDETTLTLLEAACRINPDSGHTELMRFLEMGAEERSRTLVDEGDESLGGFAAAPVYEVEYEPGHEPHSPNGVILALIAEIRRLRRTAPKQQIVVVEGTQITKGDLRITGYDLKLGGADLQPVSPPPHGQAG